MTVLAGAAVTILILGLCALGLSIGILMGRKGLRSCGRAAGENPDISCPGCSGDPTKCDKKQG